VCGCAVTIFHRAVIPRLAHHRIAAPAAAGRDAGGEQRRTTGDAALAGRRTPKASSIRGRGMRGRRALGIKLTTGLQGHPQPF
jgi:hypothetical protein